MSEAGLYLQPPSCVLNSESLTLQVIGAPIISEGPDEEEPEDDIPPEEEELDEELDEELVDNIHFPF